MLSGKATLPGRSINRAPRECWVPRGGGCIGAESEDGCTPNSNFRLLPQATLRFQVPLKDSPFQADGGFTDNKENSGGEKMVRPSFKEAKHQGKYYCFLVSELLKKKVFKWK